jgi:hypothetical protein
LTRLTLSSRSSRERLKQLEKGDTPRLLSIIAELEREMEGFVLEATENADSQPERAALVAAEPLMPNVLALSPSPSSRPSPELSPEPLPVFSSQAITPPGEGAPPKGGPLLSPMQRRIIASLNALPQLRKERTWLPDVRNSHATIVARDVANFPFHKVGHGVLRHWADSFIV